MNIICPISGETLIRNDLMLGFDYSDPHPIFRLRRKDILSEKFLHRFNRSASLPEKKLYFLAVVNCTELVDFRTPALPSIILGMKNTSENEDERKRVNRVIENNVYDLITFTSWMDRISYLLKDDLIYPRFVIDQDNNDLSNIHIWIRDLEEIRQSYVDKDKDVLRQKKLRYEHENLVAEISRAALKDMLFTHKLAVWTLDYTGLDNHQQSEMFLAILKTRAADSYGISRRLLLEFKELLLNNFDYNHPLFPHIMKQMTALIEANRTSTPDFEIFEADEIFLDDEGVEQIRSISIQESSEKKLLARTGSVDKPKREDFLTQWQYIQAMSLWTLAQKRQDKGDTNV